MKESLESSANSVEEATNQALDQLGATRDQVKVTVLSGGKKGILGFGSEMARVRVELIDPSGDQPADIAGIAKGILEELLGKMDLEASVEILPQTARTEEEEAPIGFSVRGDDLGILIGRRGQTLSSLQFLLRLMVGHQTKAWVPINIDVEDYKLRRADKLEALALRLAEQVSARRTPFTLEPMLPYERRIIHLALADHPTVTTESVGEGESRKVVIRPKR